VDPTTRAPDLVLTTDHIRRDYFDRLLADPERFFPGTKMPLLVPKNGPAPVPALAELPKELLVQSLWTYLSLGEKGRPGRNRSTCRLRRWKSRSTARRSRSCCR